ncbi:hypothetical protein HanRHA438_Chr09g0383151 [Helianthus annuus]|nr:hypothetical protein HanRHA438_Chr09g0383151 [Helianthus annuus]
MIFSISFKRRCCHFRQTETFRQTVGLLYHRHRDCPLGNLKPVACRIIEHCYLLQPMRTARNSL